VVVAYVDLDLVGDALIKLPFVRALRAAWPEDAIVWVAGRGASAYGEELRPMVAGLLDAVLERTGTGEGLAETLRRDWGGVDVFIDTQSRLGTALALRRVAARLAVRRFISPAGAYVLSDRRPPAFWRKERRLVARLLGLVALAAGRAVAPIGALRQDAASSAEAKRLLPPGPRYVAQVVGAGGRHKAWPQERHIALAGHLRECGVVPVMILGPAEAEWHAALAEAVPFARFPLQEAQAAGFAPSVALTIALARRCAVGVAGDCGGGHMLAAAERPLVSLFGPTDPAKFAPWTRHLTVVRAQDWGGQAMAAIPVQPVLEAVQATLARV
jgi:ADP-heptose:LPS heptosyltransferase